MAYGQTVVEVKGLNKLRASFDNYGVNIPKYTRRAVNIVARNIAAELRKNAPKGATGYLSSEKGVMVEKKDQDNWQIKMPYYAKFVDQGTSPHPMPMAKKAVKWASMHGMTFNRLRFAVAYKGTKAHPFINASIRNGWENQKKRISEGVRRGIKNSKR